MAGDLYCKIYVAGESSTADLRGTVAALTGADASERTLRARGLAIDVIENRDGRGQTDFIGWPHYLEIDGEPPSASNDAFLTAIRALLDGLKAQGLQVVASCDFEYQLVDSTCP